MCTNKHILERRFSALVAKHFDLSKQFKLHDNGLLRRSFVEHEFLEDLP